MPRALVALSGLTSLLVVSDHPSGTVNHTEVQRRTECLAARRRTCTVVLDEVAYFGDTTGVLVGPQLASLVEERSVVRFVARAWTDTSGAFWRISPSGAERLWLHDRARLIPLAGGLFPGANGRMWGRLRGSDTLVGFDETNTALERVSLRGVGSSFAVAQLGNGNFVVNAALHQIGRSGQPLHLFRSEGTYLRSFGAVTARFRADRAFLLMRALVECGADGGFWSGTRYDLTLERWSREGRLLFAGPIAGADATTARTRRGMSLRERDRDPQLHALGCLAERYLIVITLVRNEASAASGVDLGDIEPSERFDTRIEVRDATTGQLVAAEAFDIALTLAVGRSGFAALDLGGRGRRSAVHVFDVRLLNAQPKAR